MFLQTLLLASCLAAPTDATIEWYSGPFMNAVGTARTDGKPIMIYFWSDQSGQCSKLWQETLSKPEAAGILKDFTMVSANTANKSDYKLVERFGIKTLPTLLVLDVEGTPNDVILGNIGLENLAAEIERIQSGEGTLVALRKAVANSPRNLESHMQLAIKLGDVGNQAGYEEERAAMFSIDPKYKELPTAQMRLWQLQEALQGSEQQALSGDLKPVQEFLGKTKHEEVLYTGWGFVAGMADYREEQELGRDARVAMWEYVPEEAIAQEGFALSQRFYEQREDLSKRECKFTLQVAKATLASIETWSEGESCEAGCHCGGCTQGVVGEGEMLVNRKLYVARALDNLACALSINGKRRDALAAIDRSLSIDPENEGFLARKAELKS